MADESTGGQESGQAPDTQISTLEAVYDELEAKANEEATDGDVKDVAPTKDEVEEDSEETKEVEPEEDDNEGEAEEEDSEPPEEESTEESPDEVSAPEHWSDSDKDAFDSLPDDAKPLYLEKVKSLEGGYTKKFTDLADERKGLEAYKGFKDLFAPIEQDLGRAGLTPEQYTRQLLQTVHALKQDPAKTLQALAEQYGVNLIGKPEQSADVDEEYDEFEDPGIRALREQNKLLQGEIKSLSSKFDQTQTQTAEASRQQIVKEWQAFTTAKDDTGNDLRPEAETLREYIRTELMSNPEQVGETTEASFQRAYDTVKWINPTIRQKIDDAEAVKKSAKAVAEKKEVTRKKDLKKAKGAGRTVKSKSESVTEAPKQASTQREEIERIYDEMSAAQAS